MKKILFVFERNLSSLPPMLSVIDSLINDYEITFIVRDHEESIENLYKSKNISFLAYHKDFRSNARFFRAISRLKRYHFFRKHVPTLIKKQKYDLVWIATAEAAVLLEKPIEGVKYFFSIYELYDIVPELLKKIKPIAQRATSVIVPEINRAFMLRFWLDLDQTPMVIPNKPLSIPEPEAELPIELEQTVGKKIILYQGHITRARKLDALCEAISDMPEYILVLMGNNHENYASELSEKHSNILLIPFLAPPSHLKITSKAHIGVVTYDFTDLNGVYCAPNKIWEYSGYGVPMLANIIPGLIYTVGNSSAGFCVEMSDRKKIVEALKDIENNYESFSVASKKMYNSVDVKKLITSLVDEHIN